MGCLPRSCVRFVAGFRRLLKGFHKVLFAAWWPQARNYAGVSLLRAPTFVLLSLFSADVASIIRVCIQSFSEAENPKITGIPNPKP